jgi:hypothetical protein
MSAIRCEGLDGSNPLHFLAALGVLRLASLDDHGARLAWTSEPPHTPLIQTELDESATHSAIARHLGIRGLAALRTRRRRLLGLQESAQRALESCANDKRGKTAAKELKEQVRVRRERLRRIEDVLRDRVDAGLAKAHPFAALAASIHQVPQVGLRDAAARADPPLWRTLLPGLAADRSRQYKKDEAGLSRTRFSFSNGGSGKALLKDFRANLTRVRLADGGRDLLGFATAPEEITGLMWNPAEQRNYALRWRSPEDDATLSVPIHNVLAFVGLSFFPVVPANPSDRTNGFDDAERCFTWPLWSAALRVDTVASLLAGAFMRDDSAVQSTARGLVARFRAEVVMVDKRNFFSPSRPV